MKLIRYGITLQRVTIEDLELIRSWRNSDQIRQNMIFREEITPEMQIKWFESINNYNNFFYIIEYDNKKIGLIDNKNTNWEAGQTHSGLFIYDSAYWDTYIPVGASLILMQIGYCLLQMKETRIKVLKNNQKAIIYNQQLGFNIIDNNTPDKYYEMVQYAESFNKKTKNLHKALIKLGNQSDIYLQLHLEPHDYLNGVAQGVEQELKKLNKKYIVSEQIVYDVKIIRFDI